MCLNNEKFIVIEKNLENYSDYLIILVKESL